MLRAWIIPGILIVPTVFSGVVLSSSFVSANDVVDEISINVPVACTLSGVGMNTHTASLMPGEINSHIGETTMSAYCNDQEGFAIYAVGFTNDTYGNNKLISTTLENEEYFYTSTYTTGEDSTWAMKITTQTDPTPAYPLTIQNNFNNFHMVPDRYTLVASRSSETDVGASAVGSVFTTTYQAYVYPTQPADTYVGKVKYIIVHPASEVPNEPKSCASAKICYWPNASNVVDTMGDESISSPSSATSIVLWPSNFKRPGYGFAGWSSTYDYSDPNGFYGPQETIYFTAGQYTGTNKGLSLYAYWIPSAGFMQDWTGCNLMNIGDMTALTDLRDYETYTVAKLDDGKCWMVENLRLQHTNSDNADGLLAQGYNASFKGLAASEAANFNTNTTANSLYYIGTQDGTATIDIGSIDDPAYRIPRYNNRSTANTTSNMTSVVSNVYSYGNYYNFAASHADFTNHTDVDVDLTTSICPRGWRLPTNAALNSAGSDYWNLIVTHLGGGVNPLNMDSSAEPDYRKASQPELNDKIRQFPNNFVMAGYANGTSINGRGSNAQYMSSTSGSSTITHTLFFNSNLTRPRSNHTNKYMGSSVRCLVQ